MKPVLRLTAEQRTALLHVRDHDGKPYVRERAAALVQMADGRRASEVARSGLLRPRHPTTVAQWRARYKLHGLASLYDDHPGQRRTGSFSPSAAPRGDDGGAV